MPTRQHIAGWLFYGFAVRYLAIQSGIPPLPVVFGVVAVMTVAMMWGEVSWSGAGVNSDDES